MGRLLRLTCATGLFLAGFWLSAAPVLAAGNPGRTPAQAPDPFTAPFCGTAVGDVTITIDKDTFNAYVKTYTMQDGSTRLKINGFQAAIVQGNGKTLHLNISGPGTEVINGDSVGIFGTGHGLYIGPPGTTQPGIRLYTGNVVYALEPSGNAIVVSSTGHVTDVCKLLA
jgi:hypothetical protein